MQARRAPNGMLAGTQKQTQEIEMCCFTVTDDHVHLCLFSIEIILNNCTFGLLLCAATTDDVPMMVVASLFLPSSTLLMTSFFLFFFSSIVGEHMICRSKPVDECSLSLVMNTRFFGMNEPSTSTVDK